MMLLFSSLSPNSNLNKLLQYTMTNTVSIFVVHFLFSYIKGEHCLLHYDLFADCSAPAECCVLEPSFV